jgi:hypothetical protein
MISSEEIKVRITTTIPPRTELPKSPSGDIRCDIGPAMMSGIEMRNSETNW